MPRVNEKERTFSILEKSVNVISAVNNPKLGPYMEVFEHHPENVLLQNLGILAGFFKINDYSDESAYIVNFLSSVLKKEYYANPKKNIESSFDSALRKVNLALSEIAKEGNVNWLGKIDGVVAILEKNNIHFSVCGRAKVFLFRNKLFSEISFDMAPEDTEPNPIKTFVNVSSGRLEKDDKIMICENDIFQVFSEEEIKKGALRFPEEKFIQFIKTALINKLEIVGTIIIDVFEKEKVKPAPQKKTEETYNVFSKKVFEDKKNIPQGLSEILSQEENNGYTDGKTGHIYIQEDRNEEIKKEDRLGIIWSSLGEKVSDVFLWIRNKTKRGTMNLRRYLKNKKDQMAANAKLKSEERKRLKLEEIAKKAEEEAQRQTYRDTAISTSFFEEKAGEKNEKIGTFPESQPQQSVPTIDLGERQNSFLEKLAKRKEELEQMETQKEPVEEKNPSFFQKMLPRLGKAKEIFSKFSRKQKIYAAAILLAIFVFPYVFIKIQDAMKKKEVIQEVQVKIPDAKEILSREKNIVFLDNLESILNIQNLQKLVFLNGKLIAISSDKLTAKDGNGEVKEISWPQNYGKATQATPMNDQNSALFYTEQKKVISFFPATSQIKEATTSIPSGSTISGAGTYMSFFYLLDSASSQIYRYNWKEGGFDGKTNWLKENISLSKSCCLAIDENIYLVNNGEVIKLFKGEKQDFNLEKTSIAFVPESIFTDSDTSNLYVLDKTNGRIIRFRKDGSLVSQYFHENIKNALDFAIDEKNNKAYFIDSEELISFNLQ